MEGTLVLYRHSMSKQGGPEEVLLGLCLFTKADMDSMVLVVEGVLRKGEHGHFFFSNIFMAIVT